LEAGYLVPLKKSPLQVGITAGFGREINIITKGKPVGQGWMKSVAFYFQYKLK